MIEFGVVIHGGVGTDEGFSDGCRTACEAAFRMLEGGKGFAVSANRSMAHYAMVREG